MSLVGNQVSDRKVAANQSNAQKSTGPKTPEGKARVSRNAIKHGAFAKADNVRREIMARRGEDPAEYEELQQDLVDSCQPEDTLQAMVVKTIGDKTWDKLRLRRTLLDRQLGSLQLAQARRQRQQLAARRWPAGAHPGADRGLCGTEDSLNKFRQTVEHLDRLQEWFQKGICPDEYPDVMDNLYGEFPTVPGERIRALFIRLLTHLKSKRPLWASEPEAAGSDGVQPNDAGQAPLAPTQPVLNGEGMVQGRGRQKNRPKRASKPTMWLGINDLTKKTNPKQTQSKATKSFRSDRPLENKPKAKPLSPLNRYPLLKQTHCVKGQL